MFDRAAGMRSLIGNDYSNIFRAASGSGTTGDLQYSMAYRVTNVGTALLCAAHTNCLQECGLFSSNFDRDTL